MTNKKGAKIIGLFGGTFDPIHHGHINLALELKEKCHLDEVWLIPTGASPLRLPPSPFPHRLNMAKLAVLGIKGFQVLDIEESEGTFVYTIDTLRKILKKFRDHSFVLLLGEDAAISFPLWKEADEIVKLVPIYIGTRGGEGLKNFLEKKELPNSMREALQKGVVKTAMLDIEATVIRKRIQNKLYLEHLVPRKVLDYIYENQLYSIC